MSVLAYPRKNDEEIFRQCTKDCGVVTATEDFQSFALCCIFCSEKFLYFDAFIGHMQTVHMEDAQRTMEGSGSATGASMSYPMSQPMSLGVADDDDVDVPHDYANNGMHHFDEIEDLTDADTALLEPQMVIKQELQELDSSNDDDAEDIDDEEEEDANNLPVPDDNDNDDVEDESEAILPENDVPTASARPRIKLRGAPPQTARHRVPRIHVKSEPLPIEGDESMDEYGENEAESYADDNSGEYQDYSSSSYNAQGTNPLAGESDFLSYDEMVEESLIGVSPVQLMHSIYALIPC